MFIFPVISGSNPEIANIDGHWRLTWSLTSGSVGISRGTRKLAQTHHVNQKTKKKAQLAQKEKMTLISNLNSYFIKTFKIYIIIWNLFVEKFIQKFSY
jgi:hypothetical protein